MRQDFTTVVEEEAIARLRIYANDLRRVSRSVCRVMSESKTSPYDPHYLQLLHENLAVTIAAGVDFVTKHARDELTKATQCELYTVQHELHQLQRHKREYDKCVRRQARRWYSPRWSVRWVATWLMFVFIVGFFVAWLLTWISSLLE